MDEEKPDSAAALWDRVGNQLQAARERQGMSLRDVSLQTRIKQPLLEALECGDIDKLPRGPFARGFARAYAMEVGLDADALLADFKSQPMLVLPSSQVSGEAALTSRAFAGRLLFSVGIMAAAIVLPRWTMDSEEIAPIEHAGMVSAVATSGVLPADESAPAANVLITQPQATAATKQSPAYARPDTAATAAPVTLTLHATAEVWIEATADGHRVAYELLPQGAQKTLTAQKTLSMRIGDAGAVQYTVNGVQGIPLGGAGAVRDLHLSFDNVTAFQAGR